MNPQTIAVVALIATLMGAAVSYGILIQTVRQIRRDVAGLKRTVEGDGAGVVKRVERIEQHIWPEKKRPDSSTHRLSKQEA